jgi:hypothetical protein
MNPESAQSSNSEPENKQESEEVPREFYLPFVRGQNPLLDDLRGRAFLSSLEARVAEFREAKDQLEQLQCTVAWQTQNQSDRAPEEQTAQTIQFLKDQKTNCQQEIHSVAYGLDAFHRHLS